MASLQADAADDFLHVDAVAAVHPGGDEFVALQAQGVWASITPRSLHGRALQPSSGCYGVIMKTTPSPWAPPASAVPYRFPCESMIRSPAGKAPSEQSPVQKLCSTFSVPSLVTSNAIPWLVSPPSSVVP